MNRKLPVGVTIAVAVIAMTVTFAVTWLLSMNIFNRTVSSVTQLQNQYSKIAELDIYTRSNFYGNIDNEFLFDRMAAGYVNGLGDRNSVYYSAKDYSELLDVESGRLVGIGVEVVRDGDGSYRIVRVYEDSPAAKAGIEVQGRIRTVGEADASGFATVKALHSALRGAAGTELELTCLYGVADEKKFTVQRIDYAAPTVHSQVENGYAYIRISAFTATTYMELDYAMRTMQNGGARAIVFDVRGVSQGLFRDSYAVIDLLCPRGTVAKSVNRTGVVSVLATSEDNFVDLPMAVLVNGGTSGAAELFAASLRDLCGSQLVGGVTAGRGAISMVRRLSDGSAISITTAMLLTGRDESFDTVGLTPDIPVDGEMVSEEMLLNPAVNNDPQILRAWEVARLMVRDRGEDPGPAVGGARPQSQSTSQGDGDTSALPQSDPSGSETQGSSSLASSGPGESSSGGSSESSAESSSGGGSS